MEKIKITEMKIKFRDTVSEKGNGIIEVHFKQVDDEMWDHGMGYSKRDLEKLIVDALHEERNKEIKDLKDCIKRRLI